MPWWWRKGKDKKGKRDEGEGEDEDEWETTPLSPDMVAPLGFNILIRELNRALSELFGDEEGFKARGFSITIGPDGLPRIREFKSRGEGGEEGELDVIDEGEFIEVVGDVKASDSKDVKVRVSGRKVIIKVKSRGVKLVSRLPCNVDSVPVKVRVRNGVVDVILRKR